MPLPEVVKTIIGNLIFTATSAGYAITTAEDKILYSVGRCCTAICNDDPSVKIVERSYSDPGSNLQCAIQYARDAGWIAKDAIEVTPAKPMPTVQTLAAADVLNERDRQKSEEGWSEAKDDSHQTGHLARAGAAYALQATNTTSSSGGAGDVWPFQLAQFKPRDFRRDLVRAAALILAEIERIDRIEMRK